MDNNNSTPVFLLLLSLLVLSIVNITNASDVPPIEWTKRIQQAQMFYTGQEPKNQQLFPYVGNGYMATQISSDSIYVGGVFNGPADSPKDPSHRARIPSFVNFEIVAASSNKYKKHMRSAIEVVGSALDVERGIYFRRVQITTSTSSTDKVMLEQRWYAHRQYRNLLVHEIYPVSPIKTHKLNVCFYQNMGSASTDLSLKSVQNSTSYQSWIGYTLIPEVDNYPLVGLAIVSTSLNRTAKTHCIDFTPDSQNLFTYLFVVNTTLDAQRDDRPLPPMEHIVNDSVKNFVTYQKLSAVPSKKYASEISMSHALLDSHIDAWSEVWKSGIEVQSVLHRDDIQLARAINSSQYYILSSVRDDWPYSLSPGSLSSDAYHGHVFWDTETWMFGPHTKPHVYAGRGAQTTNTQPSYSSSSLLLYL